ncbi:LysR family transcriptional regulator [Leptothoe kymatousa]|uniref:LysR family transcriptional regulator n=1 Tax=Leptothoe kymatousa TAU-MAC 1615 TaxID=2364775 RepID=A0ABS5Y7U0_9CYAN|nr:LysR family transcriptional regulator [Leptothoe kymatousa]MBT9313651.1 LysR family transcriptional regulator [Leptothoe kymatousa TAU-MAC 1615]
MKSSQFLQDTSLSFRNLQTFLIIAEEMSFSQAAERLGIAQPPLSRQVQRLESQLNVKLFERTRPRIRLTDAGQIFAETAKSILQQMENSMQAVQLVEQGLVGHLSIGIDSAAPACDRAVQLISSYQRQYTDIEFKIHELSGSQQLTALRLGHIDMGFLVPPTIPKDIKAQTLVEESLVIALPAEHPLAAQPQITLADISQSPLVMNDHHSQILMAHGQYADLQSQIKQTISDSRLLMSLVASGLGLSVVPISISHSHSRPDIAFRPIVPNIQVVSLAAVWHQYPKSTIAPFIDFLSAGSRQL